MKIDLNESYKSSQWHGRALRARPCCGRYEHMKLTVCILISFYVSDLMACAGCSNCIMKNYDLVAKVTLIEENSDYKNAFNARIDKVISIDWQASQQANAKPLSYPSVEEDHYIKIVETGVIPISSGTNRISSCSRRYAVGDKLLFYATEIQEGFFESDLCTCTQRIEKGS